MYKNSAILLLFVFCFINANPLEESNNIAQERPLFTSQDPQRIKLDKYIIVQQQLNHLTKDAPFFTSPTKGLCTSLGGGLVIIAGSFIKDENVRHDLQLFGALLTLGGGAYAAASGLENAYQRFALQLILHPRNNPRKSLEKE